MIIGKTCTFYSEKGDTMLKDFSIMSLSAVSNGKELSEKAAKKYGTEIKYDRDGKIYIKNPDMGVSFIEICFPRPFSENALVYGDAFERGYGDLQWKKDRRDTLRWYFVAADGNDTYGFGVKTQPNALCSWQISDDTVKLVCDIRSGTNETRHSDCFFVAELVFLSSAATELHDFCRQFCKAMCDEPSFCDRPVFGANDWYCNYGNSSAEKILRAAKFAVHCADGLPHKPFVVIDDGWQKNHNDDFNGGEWDGSNENFGDMKTLAARIKDLGAIPGLWFRPLQSKAKLPKECFTDRNEFLLDPSHPQVLNSVASDIKRFYDWGFRLVKYDFVTADIFQKWGFEMSDDYFSSEMHFFDTSKTTAEIIKNFYRTIRNAAPDDMLLLGCNAVGHLAAGLVNMQRTGDDTSGEQWERTKKMGVNTLAFRMMQHGTFFDADADCVGITDKVPLHLNARWLDVLSKSSTPLFVSVAENCETDETASLVSQAFANAVKYRQPSVPVDWLDTLTPHNWYTDVGSDKYEWE